VYLTQLLVNLPAIGDDRGKLMEWLPDRWKVREAERAAASGMIERTRRTPTNIDSCAIVFELLQRRASLHL
jgi:hypothetical protein